MKSIDLTINKALIFVTFIVLAEMFYAPHPRYVKMMGVFPAVNITGYAFTIAELFIYAFISISFIYVLIKILTVRKFTLGPKEFVPTIIVFILLLIINIIIGVLNSNDRIIQYFRMIIYPAFLYFILLHINISVKTVRSILRLLFSGLVMSLLLFRDLLFLSLIFIGCYFVSFRFYLLWFTCQNM